MEIHLHEETGFSTLRITGDVDASSSIHLDSMIASMIQQGKYRIHADMSGVNYISSAGMGVFISFMDELKASGGAFVLSGLQAPVKEVFELLGLHQIIPMVSTAEEAAQMFQHT